VQSTISARIRNRLVREGGVASHDRVAQALSNEGIVLSEDALRHLVVELEQEFNGAGILQPLIDTPGVTDILVNGTEYIWWDRGSGMERTALCFESEADVRRYAQRLANIAGRRLDDASPLVDAQLPDGTRVHCVLAPIAVAGTSISLRIPSATTLTLEHLRDQGSIDGQVHEVLLSIMQSRLAFVVSGGTGSGKTTILSALLAHVPHDHRIVIVEDSSELNPRHPHVVRLQSRLANVEGAGAITMRELVRNSLRMRPTRIVVGEVRGAEVVDLLSALNTGHEGGCGTVHANSPTDVPTRLEALGLTAGLDRIALHALMGAGLDAIVHVHRLPTGARIVHGIHVTQRSTHGLVHTAPAITWDGHTWVRDTGWNHLHALIHRGDSP